MIGEDTFLKLSPTNWTAVPLPNLAHHEILYEILPQHLQPILRNPPRIPPIFDQPNLNTAPGVQPVIGPVVFSTMSSDGGPITNPLEDGWQTIFPKRL